MNRIKESNAAGSSTRHCSIANTLRGSVLAGAPLVSIFFSHVLFGATRDDLMLLQNRCLTYAAGYAPKSPATTTMVHGLYAQSPFSPTGEIDLAATGFALAALPSAVGNGVISYQQAQIIAANAAQKIRTMVQKSNGAATAVEIQIYGFRGVLFHYYIWDPIVGEFRGKAGAEISSIDTTILMYGLMISANYFRGQVLTDYEAARDTISWHDWLDVTTPGQVNRFRMSYVPGTGFSGWWDNPTQETMLICTFAAMSDPSIDPATVWRAWPRQSISYVSPGSNPQTFTCYATYFGDPFTVFYGLTFLDLKSFGTDLDGTDWYTQGQTSFKGNVEYFKKERGFLDSCVYTLFRGAVGATAIAKPKISADTPYLTNQFPIFGGAGALQYYSSNPDSNELAMTLSRLVQATTGFFDWHGWPVGAVDATSPSHPVVDNSIVGQDILLIGLAIDNYFTNRIQNIVLQDSRMRRTLMRIFPGIKPANVRGDVNGDGLNDFVFQNGAGQLFEWFLDGTGATINYAVGTGLKPGSKYLFGSGLGDWRLVARADLNSDGISDLIFQNSVGQIFVWFLDGTGTTVNYATGTGLKPGSKYLYAGTLGDWRIVAATDVSGDGVPDLIFQNSIGQIYKWLLDGSGSAINFATGSGLKPGSGFLFFGGSLGDWRIVASADVNSDGISDLVFQNSVGQIFMWLLDGTGTTVNYATGIGLKPGSTYLYGGTLGDWRIVAATDANGDGIPDLVFQNSIGQIYKWLLDGTANPINFSTGAGLKPGSGYLFSGGLGDWRIR